jgi:hypothetical protein
MRLPAVAIEVPLVLLDVSRHGTQDRILITVESALRIVSAPPAIDLEPPGSKQPDRQQRSRDRHEGDPYCREGPDRNEDAPEGHEGRTGCGRRVDDTGLTRTRTPNQERAEASQMATDEKSDGYEQCPNGDEPEPVSFETGVRGVVEEQRTTGIGAEGVHGRHRSGGGSRSGGLAGDSTHPGCKNRPQAPRRRTGSGKRVHDKACHVASNGAVASTVAPTVGA